MGELLDPVTVLDCYGSIEHCERKVGLLHLFGGLGGYSSRGLLPKRQRMPRNRLHNSLICDDQHLLYH